MDNVSKRLRSQAQAQVDNAHEERKRQLFKHRLELARSAMRSFERRNAGEAAKTFFQYLRILEDWKKVDEGGLTPAHFDIKEDIHELLLISGVYWDLTKLYDRTKTEERLKEFQHFLEKFVVFARGMPYEHVAGETLRKYINHGRPTHPEDFKRAYRTLVPKKCFVVGELALLTRPADHVTLREFRDEVLKKTPYGRRFVAWYYRRGPRLADWLSRRNNVVRKTAALAISAVARALRLISLR